MVGLIVQGEPGPMLRDARDPRSPDRSTAPDPAIDPDPLTTPGLVTAPPRVRSATAVELAARIGVLDIGALEDCSAVVAAAVAELAEDAGRSGIVDLADPLVVQLRALGRLAVHHSTARSATAVRLLHDLAPTSGVRGESPHPDHAGVTPPAPRATGSGSTS